MYFTGGEAILLNIFGFESKSTHRAFSMNVLGGVRKGNSIPQKNAVFSVNQ